MLPGRSVRLPRLPRYYPVVALLVFISLIIGLIITIALPKATHAVQPHVDNGLIGWPFSPMDASWQIETGYDAINSPDHNCKSHPDCYERYGLDFIATNRSAAGLPVYSPATGSVLKWAALGNQGMCFNVAISNATNMYIMVCHVVLDNPAITYTHKGDRVGTVYNADMQNNTHLHMNLYSSPDPSLNSRPPVPFSDPWMIGGCNYQLAPGETDPNYVDTRDGVHAGETVPCGNQGASPGFSFQWGSTSWPGQGMYLNRNVLVEVRNTIDSPDLISQTVQTDANGNGSLTFSGLTPGYYTVMIKPEGFLREATNIKLNVGSNSFSFPMTTSGVSCINGQGTGPQMWLGDVNGDNVINSADYNIIYNYYNRQVPSGYTNLTGDPAHTFTGVDYNIWLRSICFFGYGTGAVVGAGGRMDTPAPQLAHSTQAGKGTSSQGKVATSGGGGVLSLSPSAGDYRVGQAFNVAVQASVPVSLTGVDIVLHYDPKVLSVNSIKPIGVFPSTPVSANDPTLGEINITSASNPNQPVNIGISATLVYIQFRVIGSGQTNVTFDYNANAIDRSNMAEQGVDTQVLSAVYNATFNAGLLHVPQDYPTIKAALAAAQPAETVIVLPGTYHEQFSVPDNVSLQGQDPTTTIINGDGINNQPVVYLGTGSTISGFTITNSGTNFYDAALWIPQGPATVTNMHLTQNSMGIVRFCSSAPCSDSSTITNNVITNNTYTGILIHGAQADVENNTVVSNALQGITFESSAQGNIIDNIVTNAQTGITGTSATTLVNNVLWQNTNNYASGTTPGTTDAIATPLFLNASAGDYRVHAASAAINSVGTSGAYVFSPTGSTPTNLTASQSSQGVKLSWQTTGATGYTVCATGQNTSYFSQCFDAGNTTSYTFSSSSLSGTVSFAVASYDAQGQESFPAYINVVLATASIIVKPTSGAYNQNVTITGSKFGASELVNIYLDNTGTFSVASASATSTGSFTIQFKLPQATYGKHTFIAQGLTSGITASVAFTVKSSAKLLHGSGLPGSRNTITGYGFAANETVNVYWATSGGLLLGTASANSLGTVTLNFTVPKAAIGTYKIYMVGQKSKASAYSTYKLT